MTITRNMTVEVAKEGDTIVVEVYDHVDMVDSFRTWDGNGFVRHIDHMLHDRGYQRTGSWQNLTKDLMTFKVDHYGN